MRSVSYIMRLAACLLILVIYVFAWRPVRRGITQKVVSPQLVNAADTAYTVKSEGVALRVSFPWRDSFKNVQYRPQAGFFFLIAMMTLVISACDYKWYVWLAGLHLAATVCTAGLMIISKSGWYAGFILVDLVGTYLVPVLSLALAAWVVSIEKGEAM